MTRKSRNADPVNCSRWLASVGVIEGVVTTISDTKFMKATNDLLVHSTIPKTTDFRYPQRSDGVFYFLSRFRLAAEIAFAKVN